MINELINIGLIAIVFSACSYGTYALLELFKKKKPKRTPKVTFCDGDWSNAEQYELEGCSIDELPDKAYKRITISYINGDFVTSRSYTFRD